MKVILRIGLLVAVGIVIFAAAQPANAICSDSSTFNMTNSQSVQQVLTDPGASGTVAFPAHAATVRANFWGLGGFNAAPAAGNDNGTFDGVSQANDSSTGLYDWLRGNGLGLYIAGDWSASVLIDGCVQTPPPGSIQRMAALISDTSPAGNTAFFAAICVAETNDAGFDFSTVGNNAMVQIPKPVLSASSKAGNNVNVTVAPSALVGGLYTNNCALANTGYRVYAKVQPQGAPAPNSRDRVLGGWGLPVGSAPSLATPVVLTNVPCGPGNSLWLSLSLNYDTPSVETGYNGPNSLQIKCDLHPDLATPVGDDDNFRIIRKPKTLKGK